MDNEERDLWRSFLERGDYASASRYASTQAERNEVSRAEADVAFQEGRYVHAAQLWGRIRSAEPSFEEVALRFVGAAATDALQEFLLARLQVLSPEDKAQATMVASWVVELYLDHINRAMLEETPEASTSGQQHEQALRDFLRDHVDVLDVNVTIGLLASYGRLDDLMHYATYRQDNETVLEYLLQRGDVAKALAVLRLPNVSQELAYKFAPALLAAMPSDTIDAWMAASPPLDPRRLLPALMRIAEGSAPSAAAPSSLQEEALRYVEYCIHKLGSTDSAVHNLAVSLYCWDKDERRLLEYLQSARDSLGKPWYEPQFALRVARQHGRLNACVRLLCELGLHEDAVALALTFDRTLATAVAARVEDDEALKRKLWLAIAQNLINASSADDDADPRERVAAVVEVLEEADGCIRIEDVLPLFPDFVTIDAFKAAICASLEDYNSHIERLKFEMSDATRMADALRRDMAALEGQAGTLNLSEPCARCGSAIGAAAGASAAPAGGAMPRYYLFPTGNAFHGSCLAAEVIELAGPQQRSHILSLCNRLSQMSAESALLSNGKGPPEAEKLLQNLESHIAVEDPYNGEAVVRNISKDFIDPNDAELESWHF